MIFVKGRDSQSVNYTAGEAVIDDLVERIVQTTRSVQAVAFYRRVIRQLGDGIVEEELGELRYRMRTGEVRDPARYFGGKRATRKFGNGKEDVMALILLLIVLFLALARTWPYSNRRGNSPHGALTAVSTRRGIVAMIFGLLAFQNPGTTLNYLVVFFGAYAILDGLATIDAAAARPRYRPFVVEGVISVIVGALTFLSPANAAIILLYLMAFWAAFSGLTEIVARERFVLMRALLLLFGFAILIVPITGTLPITTWFGFAALVFGIMTLTLAIWRRAFGREIHRPRAVPRAA